jgi:poly(A) polymerase
MRSARRLDPQPWMTAPETAAVLRALATGGREARFVGGCVRDALLGRPIGDIDLATPDPPERVMELLAAADITVVPTGLKHGTITAVVDKRHVEITTLRRDVETYGRHAKVEYTDDWEADASRRDFTMNALFCAPDGALYDAFGGIEDLLARRVRFVGEPEARIREDVLRLLRYFRFYAHYGAPPPDADALAACRALAHLLPTLSGERVCQETLKLLRAPDPAAVFALMREQGILPHLLPEATRIDRLGALATVESAAPRDLAVRPDAVRRLGALLDDAAATASAVASRLRFSNADRDRLVAIMADGGEAIDLALDPAARRRAIYRLGTDAFIDRALVAWAGRRANDSSPPRPDDPWFTLIRFARDWPVPKFPLQGRDALHAGVPPGPAVGDLMERLEAWWIAGDFTADRKACVKKLKELAPTATSPPAGGS